MLEDSQVLVLLTQEKLVERLPDAEKEVRAAGIARAEQNSEIPNPIVVCLDKDWETACPRGEREPNQLCTQPDNLAYIIYTSGSTGSLWSSD